MIIGVLGLQGDVREHAVALEEVGADAVPVRRPSDLRGLAGIVLPGGESTTLSMLLESSGLFDPLHAALRQGLPVFGTCAGLILLANTVVDGRADQRSFAVADCSVRRNGFGRQADSFETSLSLGPAARAALGGAAELAAVFIRAPVVEAVGSGVEVLGALPSSAPAAAGSPTVIRQGSLLATTFHPELTSDRRLHRLFVGMAGSARSGPDPIR